MIIRKCDTCGKEREEKPDNWIRISGKITLDVIYEEMEGIVHDISL